MSVLKGLLEFVGVFGGSLLVLLALLALFVRGNIEPVHPQSKRQLDNPVPNLITPPMCLDAYEPVPDDEPTYDDTEAALFDTLQAAEYRVPYEPSLRWPLYEQTQKPEMRAVTERVQNANGDTCLVVVGWEPVEPGEAL